MHPEVVLGKNVVMQMIKISKPMTMVQNERRTVRDKGCLRRRVAESEKQGYVNGNSSEGRVYRRGGSRPRNTHSVAWAALLSRDLFI
ncbi:hypothetical protein TNCV_2305131 [Trichonephila clavipes]|nr:hypothetical protein TNCV_2305131 [Trichonephila clavipes]